MTLYLLAIAGMSLDFAWRQRTGDGCSFAAAGTALAVGNAGFRWEARWERRESALLLGAFALMVAVLALLPSGVALLE